MKITYLIQEAGRQFCSWHLHEYIGKKLGHANFGDLMDLRQGKEDKRQGGKFIHGLTRILTDWGAMILRVGFFFFEISFHEKLDCQKCGEVSNDPQLGTTLLAPRSCWPRAGSAREVTNEMRSELYCILESEIRLMT